MRRRFEEAARERVTESETVKEVDRVEMGEELRSK